MTRTSPHVNGRNAFLPIALSSRQRAALRALACALAWLLCACTTSAAVESLCDDGLDQDDDNLIDCHDPDCQASDDCVGAHAAEIRNEDAAVRKPPLLDAGHRPKTELEDAWAGTPGQPDGALVDSGELIPPAVDEDAGPPDPCTLCAPDEACVDAKCQPAVSATSGAYTLHILSGVVPMSDAITVCYDSCLLTIGLCTCPPDPYVRVVLRRDGKDTLLGMTEVVQNDAMPQFPANAFDLDLAPGDILRFEVYDFDEEPDQPDLLYTCRVDLRGLSTGAPMSTAVDCVGLAGVGNSMPFRITGELVPRTGP